MIRVLEDKETGVRVMYDDVKMKPLGVMFFSHEDPDEFLRWMSPIEPNEIGESSLLVMVETWRKKVARESS